MFILQRTSSRKRQLLQSPTWKVQTLLSMMSITRAVHPQVWASSPCAWKNSQSSSKKVLFMSTFTISLRSPASSSSVVHPRTFSTKCCFTKSAHSGPPCPSSTANRLMSFHSLPPTSSSITRASSMPSRKPWSSPVPALKRIISKERLPMRIWLWRVRGTYFSGSILVKILVEGSSLPLRTYAMGCLPWKMSSGSPLTWNDSHPISRLKSFSGSLRKCMLRRRQRLPSSYQLLLSSHTRASFSTSLASKGYPSKWAQLAAQSWERVLMPLYSSTSLRQLTWYTLHISSISLMGTVYSMRTMWGPIEKCSPSLISTPSWAMFIQVPDSEWKSITLKLLKPSYFSWACLGARPTPSIWRVSPQSLTSPDPKISPSGWVVMKMQRFLQSPSMHFSTYLRGSSFISVMFIFPAEASKLSFVIASILYLAFLAGSFFDFCGAILLLGWAEPVADSPLLDLVSTFCGATVCFIALYNSGQMRRLPAIGNTPAPHNQQLLMAQDLIRDLESNRVFYYHDADHPFAQMEQLSHRRVHTERVVSHSPRSHHSRDKSPKTYLQELVRVRKALRRETKRRAQSQAGHLPGEIAPKARADGFSLTFRRNSPSPKQSVSKPSPKPSRNAKQLKIKSFTSVLNIQKLDNIAGTGLLPPGHSSVHRDSPQNSHKPRGKVMEKRRVTPVTLLHDRINRSRRKSRLKTTILNGWQVRQDERPLGESINR